MSSIPSGAQLNSRVAPMNVNIPSRATAVKDTFKPATQEANSSEEKAIAASTTLSKELSKGDKKSTIEDVGRDKRLKLLEKISNVNNLNLSNEQVDQKAAQMGGQIKSGQNLIKSLLDSSGGESVLKFAALKKLKSTEDPDSEIGLQVAKYLDVLMTHKNKSITSWVNTSASIANTTTDKDMAFKIQSMLSNASEHTVPTRNLLRSVIQIGGEHRCTEVQQSSIKALSADIRSGATSADLGTLSKTLSTLSNFESISSMFKLAEEQLGKLSKGEGSVSMNTADYLEISLDISLNQDPVVITSYSIAVLDASPESEYKFCHSMLQAFSDYPQSIWNDSDERQAAISSVSNVMHSLSDPTKHAESSIRGMLLQ